MSSCMEYVLVCVLFMATNKVVKRRLQLDGNFGAEGLSGSNCVAKENAGDVLYCHHCS